MRWVDHATISQPASRASGAIVVSTASAAAIPDNMRTVPAKSPLR